MVLKQELTSILTKKMDRKDFLKHVGVAVIALTGFGAVVKTLSASDSGRSESAVGYGGSAYGGNKQS